MQFGIITNQPIKHDNGLETVEMGLIDYKEISTTFSPLVVLRWTREAKKDYAEPELVEAEVSFKNMVIVGSVLKSLGRIGEHLNDPANLLHIIQKQLARHVVFDPRQGVFVPARSLKETDTQWTASDSKGKVFATVEAEEAKEAKEKIIRRMSSDAATKTDAAKLLIDWLSAGQVIKRLDGVDGAPPEFAPLSVYSRRAAKKTE